MTLTVSIKCMHFTAKLQSLIQFLKRLQMIDFTVNE